MNSNQVTEDGMPPLSEINERDLSIQENEIRPQFLVYEEGQPVNEVCSQSLVPEHRVSPYVQDSMPQRDSGSDSPHAQGPTPLR